MTRRRLAPGVYCKKENVPKLLAELKRNGIDEPITDSYAVCGPVLTHERKFKLFVFRFAAGPEHEYIVLGFTIREAEKLGGILKRTYPSKVQIHRDIVGMNLLVNGGYGIQNTGSPGSFEIIDPELYVRSLMQTVRTLRTALYKTLQSLDSGIIPQELQQLLASFVVSGDID